MTPKPARWNIDDAAAAEIAAAVIRERGLGSGVKGVYLLEEIPSRIPSVYNLPAALADCWIAYAEPGALALASSNIVVIEGHSGEVVYAGSANDEG